MEKTNQVNVQREKFKRKRHKVAEIPNVFKKQIENIPESFDKPSLAGAIIDATLCRLIYGASIQDYFDFRFYSLNNRGRKSFATVRDKFDLYNKYNDVEKCKIFGYKEAFNAYYKKYTGRNYLYISADLKEEEYKSFIESEIQSGVDRFIYKPVKGDSGMGIYFIEAKDPQIFELTSIKNKGEQVVESVLANHPDIKKLHPYSLNTMRIPTLIEDGQVKIMGAYQRIGNNKAGVDNANSGGMVTEIDVATGIIVTPAIDHNGKQYIKHPITEEIIVGLQVPYWEEVIGLVTEVAQIIPEVKYVGWDVAVTPQGPIIVEGNSCSSMQLQQIPQHIGKRYLYLNALKKECKK